MCTTELTPHEVAVWASSESLRRYVDGEILTEQIPAIAHELETNGPGLPRPEMSDRGSYSPRPSSARSPAPSPNRGHADAAHKSFRILVVDDEPTIAEFVAHVLTDDGFEVRCAGDGFEALAEVEEGPPDLVLTDIKMPRLSGLDLMDRLHARDAAMPVVLMSAVYNDVDIPGVHFIPKPFDIDHLTTVVHRALRDAAA